MAFVGDPTRWERPVSVQVPKSKPLAALLHGAGTPNEKYVGAVSAAADPNSGASNVLTLPSTPQARGRMGVADAVAQDLAEILNRTPAGTPGRDELAFVAAQLGVTEDQADEAADGTEPQEPTPTGEGF